MLAFLASQGRWHCSTALLLPLPTEPLSGVWWFVLAPLLCCTQHLLVGWVRYYLNLELKSLLVE